ncbi:hypothetical protein P7K49_003078, partial [Saguinus oedipus]
GDSPGGRGPESAVFGHTVLMDPSSPAWELGMGSGAGGHPLPSLALASLALLSSRDNLQPPGERHAEVVPHPQPPPCPAYPGLHLPMSTIGHSMWVLCCVLENLKMRTAQWVGAFHTFDTCPHACGCVAGWFTVT